MNDEYDNLLPVSTGSTPTDAHIAMNMVLTRVVLEVARRRQDQLASLLESLQDNVLLTVGGTSRPVHGWFFEGAWRLGDRPVHELFLNGDQRSERGVPISAEEEVLVTLLHECCHVYAQANGIKDTSQDGRYHNRRFAEIALMIGLQIMKDSRIGHHTPQLSAWARDEYADLLSELKSGLVLVREPQLTLSNPLSENDNQSKTADDTDPTSAGRSKYVFVSCRCRVGRGLRTGRFATGSWEPGAIGCHKCGGLFEESLTKRG